MYPLLYARRLSLMIMNCDYNVASLCEQNTFMYWEKVTNLKLLFGQHLLTIELLLLHYYLLRTRIKELG